MADPHTMALRITSPSDASVVGDGDLVLIEGMAVDPADGDPSPVQVSLDDGATWGPADLDPTDPGHWRYLWSDPALGVHKIRARAIGDNGSPTAEEAVSARIEDTWSTSFFVDNPYALAGSYRKGQMHIHTTRSFDGWTSLSPADDALEYKRRGYQFVVLTDHDVYSNAEEVNDDTFITIPGFESTSDLGHIAVSFTSEVIPPDQPAQDRLDAINRSGGLAILAHPDWQVGWTSEQLRDLRGFFAFDIFNGITTVTKEQEAKNADLWKNALNSRGWDNRAWVVAVDDSHNPGAIDKGWVMVKSPELTQDSIKQSLLRGAFYASNGPSFKVLGVLRNAITASSPDASVIRFIDQDGKVVAQGPASWAGYRPSGRERWVRVEAVMDDGRTAWSQPFWLMPNRPQVSVSDETPNEIVLAGETLPGAQVYVSDNGESLGSVVADEQGRFVYRIAKQATRDHTFWVFPTAPWPDHVGGRPAIFQYPS
jgi:hypothetical protein